MLARRWSPRAFDPDFVISEDELGTLLEAARWAPSSGNTQPARYFAGRRGDATFTRIFELLVPGNQVWAGNAAALLLGVAVTANAKGPIPYAEYGVGLSSENLVLQAVAAGMVAHQMAGFDHEAAGPAFGLPENVRPLVAIAVGRLGPLDVLPADLRTREQAPRARIPLSEFAYAETWGAPFCFAVAGPGGDYGQRRRHEVAGGDDHANQRQADREQGTE